MDYKTFLIKLTKNWKFLVFALLFLSALNLYFINRNLIYKKYEIKESPLFKTYKVTGNCFYQIKDSLKWLFLNGEELIYPGSQIQSDEDSHVILSFLNQSGKIEMAEKTLVLFYQNDKDVIVEFKKGEMFLNYQSTGNQKNIFIRIGTRIFKFSNSDLFISGDVDSIVSVFIDYGRVTMEQEGLASNFEKGQGLILKPGKEFTVTESKFSISTPLNYDRYSLDVGDTMDVRIAFSRFNHPLYYQLYIGDSPDTLKEYFKTPTELRANEVSVNLPKGSYYWQLAAYEMPNSKPLFYSSLKRFFIEPKISIQPVLPQQNASIALVNGKASIQFQWDNPSQIERVNLEVASDKNFANIVINENIPNNNYFIAELLKPGTYYWRISGFPFGTSDLLTGPSKKFKVVEDDVLGKIDLNFPKKNTILTTLSLKNSDITFQWSMSPGTARYKIFFVKKINDQIREMQASVNSIKVSDLEPGEYEWYVQDSDNSKIMSDKSSFVVLKTKKIDFIAKSKLEQGLLSWEQGPQGTVSYRVEVMKIGSKSNFNEFFNPKSSYKTQFNIKKEQLSYKKFEEGVYAFKVYALTKDKKIIADTTLRFLKVGSY